METIILAEPGRFEMTQTAPPDAPGPGEALLRIHRVGVCGTDFHAFRGRQPFFTYPRILGHELGVEVLALGPGASGVRVGDHCAVRPYLSCGHCVACSRGRSNCCVDLKVLGVHIDGGMRETICTPASCLHPSQKLTLEQLALVETLGIGAHAVRRAAPDEGENLLVIGAGPIGLSVIQFARQAGARVMVMDVNENRLRFCREASDGVTTILAGSDSVPQIEALCQGDLPTVVMDATGNPASMMGAFQYTASGGRLVFVGLCQDDITFHDPEFHRKELTLYATRNSTAEDFDRVIHLVEEGIVDTQPWITHRSSSQAMPAAFPGWLDPAAGVIKAVVEFS